MYLFIYLFLKNDILTDVWLLIVFRTALCKLCKLDKLEKRRTKSQVTLLDN